MLIVRWYLWTVIIKQNKKRLPPVIIEPFIVCLKFNVKRDQGKVWFTADDHFNSNFNVVISGPYH